MRSGNQYHFCVLFTLRYYSCVGFVANGYNSIFAIDIISAYLHSDIISASDLTSVVRVRRVFANGAHVVIRGLCLAYNFSIDVHKRNPPSLIPQSFPLASRTRSVFAKGLHVVIYLQRCAFKFSIASHSRNPLSLMLQDAIFNIRNDFANGAHVVMLLLFHMFNSTIDVQRRNPSSFIIDILDAFNMRRDFAKGAHVDILSLLLIFNLVIDVHKFNPEFGIDHSNIAG